MTEASSFISTVEETNKTALSRLGSSRSLYAATAGDIDTEPVLIALVEAEHAAVQTFSDWAETESHPIARNLWEDLAAVEEQHLEVAQQLLAASHQPGNEPALHTYLRNLTSPESRVGGLIGRILASQRSKDQLIGYFIGAADPQTTDVIRSFRADLDEQFTDATEAIESICTDDEAWVEAETAATGAIQATYEEYVEQLEALGVNPKPVC